MRSYWVGCADLSLGIQVDRLDQRNRTALHGCLWVLVVPLHAHLESSPPQSLELLSGYAQGGWSLPGKDAPNQHTSVHVCDLSGMHHRHNIIVRAHIQCFWRARGRHWGPVRGDHTLQVSTSHFDFEPDSWTTFTR